MTIEEALKVVQNAMYGLDKILIGSWQDANLSLPDPTADTPGGLAEFARLLLWALREFDAVDFARGYSPSSQPYETYVRTLDRETLEYTLMGSRFDNTPQEAFVHALAAAIEARGKGEK